LTWTEVKTTGPSARWHYGLATFGGKAVLFGGDGSGGWLGGSTWQWDGAVWNEAKVQGPNARYVYTMAAR
jgi:hypothetical protein